MGIFKNLARGLGLAKKGASVDPMGGAPNLFEDTSKNIGKMRFENIFGKESGSTVIKQVAPVQEVGTPPPPPAPIPAPEPTLPAAQDRAEPKVKARVKLMKKARTFFGGGGLVKTITNYLTGQ